MIKTTYNEYLVNTINQVLETYNDKKREKVLKAEGDKFYGGYQV